LSSRVQAVAVVAAAVVVAVVIGAWALIVEPKLRPSPIHPAVASAVASVTAHDRVVILEPRVPSQGIVVYAHGNNQDERAVLTGANVAPVAGRLLREGYYVVGAYAGGNAWGNPGSLAEYERVISEVRSLSDVDDVFLWGESMGGLPSLELASRVGGVKAWAGVYPVCDARTVMGQGDLLAGIEQAYPDRRTGAVSPVAMPDVPLMFWASPDDTRVPKATNTDACAAKAKGRATVITTKGNHGDPSNFDPDALAEFFNQN
jgi:fermentation-respiration switch protein FrsA (DUF1100 family)